MSALTRLGLGGLGLCGWALATLLAHPGTGLAQSAAAPDCAGLIGLKIEDTNLLSATVVPAKEGLPEYCRVLGYVRPAINFEIRLPTKDWNGKFYMAGCGGFCGKLLSDAPGFVNAMNYGLKRNYAVSTMDSGHWGLNVLDGRWAYNNRVAEWDWGQRAVPETARVTKAVIKAYYNNDPAKSYFAGCSTGGRMANMEATRFPTDFDGIISGAPALDYTGLVATFFAWLTQADIGPSGGEILARAKVPMVAKAVNDYCDAKDGLKDGLIADPRRCDFQPKALQCKGADAPDCLTAAEVGVVEKWYGGAKDSKGQQIYPGGLPLGSEPYWPNWLTGNPAGGVRLIPIFNANFLLYMAFAEDPPASYSVQDFNFDKDPQRLELMASIYNSMSTDLTKFKERGGKLLMYHGWADPIVTPQNTVDWYEATDKKMGGGATSRDTVRLFMVPGMDHCGLGSGPGVQQDGFDPLAALEQWVEQGQAPAMMMSTKRDKDGRTLWQRPLCPYPQAAKYKGSGDPNDAASFTCAE